MQEFLWNTVIIKNNQAHLLYVMDRSKELRRKSPLDINYNNSLLRKKDQIYLAELS